jgi:hypothetical protein
MSARPRWSRLTADEVTAIVGEFAAALGAIREIETDRMRHSIQMLELWRDEMAKLTADIRAGRL